MRKLGFLFIMMVLFCFSEEILLIEKNKEIKFDHLSPAIFKFNLPPVKEAKLYFLARAESEKVAGYADALLIQINGKIVGPEKLINKPLKFYLKGRPEKEMTWYQNNSWMIPISPDYSSIKKHYLYDVPDINPHEFIFDIKEFLKEENELKFIRIKRPWSEIPLFMRDLKIIYERSSEKELKKKESVSEEKQIVISLAKDLKIYPEETKIFSLPLREKNKKILLDFECYRDSEKYGGWGYYLQIKLNGVPINAYKNRYEKRLLNKKEYFTRRNEKYYWCLGDGIWHTFFVPNSKIDLFNYGIIAEEPFRNIIDITDLLKSEGTNFLSVSNLYSKVKQEEYNLPLSLNFSLNVIFSPSEKEKKEEIKREFKVGKIEPEIEIMKGGGFILKIDEEKIKFCSEFSYSGGNFVIGEILLPKDVSIEFKDLQKNRISLYVKNKFYWIFREINIVNKNCIQIKDKFENKSNRPLGIIFSNYFLVENLPFDRCIIGGRDEQSLNYVDSYSNPTIFFPLKNFGMGIVIEDDVCRNQSKFYFDTEKKQAGFKDEIFSIDSNSSYTVIWDIYILNSGDYYDFINLVRKDWGLDKIKIEGPVYFVNYESILNSDEEALKKLIEEKNAKYICFWEVRTKEPIEEFGRPAVAMGTGIFHPAFKKEVEKVKQAVKKLKKISPDIKVALYSHSFFISPEKPDDLRFKDSWITDKEGKRKISQYNNPKWVDYQPVYPTLQNSYGKEYEKLIDFYLNEIGLDWIYWDESTGPGVLGEDKKFTYNIWDGNTAIISNQTGEIIQKCAILSLVCKDYFQHIIEKVKKKNGFVLFNGAANIKPRIFSPCFVETQDLILRAYETHLSTPLAYGYGKPSMEEIRRRLFHGTIYARTHLDYKSSVVCKFYPITVKEIHSGWIKGEERIITAIDGNFGWDEICKVKIWKYDRYGNLIETSPKILEIKEIKIEVPEGGIVIIEKM